MYEYMKSFFSRSLTIVNQILITFYQQCLSALSWMNNWLKKTFFSASKSEGDKLVDEKNDGSKLTPCPCEVSKIVQQCAVEENKDLGSLPLQVFKDTAFEYIKQLMDAYDNKDDKLEGETSLKLLERAYDNIADNYEIDKVLMSEEYPKCNVGSEIQTRLEECSDEFKRLTDVQKTNISKVVGAQYVKDLHVSLKDTDVKTALSNYSNYLSETHIKPKEDLLKTASSIVFSDGPKDPESRNTLNAY